MDVEAENGFPSWLNLLLFKVSSVDELFKYIDGVENLRALSGAVLSRILVLEKDYLYIQV